MKLLLEKEKRTALKYPLYPFGWGGKGLYPPPYYMPIGADALVYHPLHFRDFMTDEEKLVDKGL